MRFLVCYDLSSDRIRAKVAKHMEGKAHRIQYSVFLFKGTEKEAKELRAELLALTENDEGRGLFMAPLCEACAARIWQVGRMREEERPCIVA